MKTLNTADSTRAKPQVRMTTDGFVHVQNYNPEVLWDMCPRCYSKETAPCIRRDIHGKIVRLKHWHREKNLVLNPEWKSRLR